MLYLVKSYLPTGKHIYRVYFTDDVTLRGFNYLKNTYSPGNELISMRDGDKLFEKLLHRYLYYKGLKCMKYKKLGEWFIGCPEVGNIFHYSRKRIEKTLWKHRDKIFNPRISEDYKLLEYLDQRN